MKTSLSRREFIKVSAQGAAIAGFTGLTGPEYKTLARDSDIIQDKNPSLWVTSLVEDFTLTSSLNTLNLKPEEKAFDKPIVVLCKRNMRHVHETLPRRGYHERRP